MNGVWILEKSKFRLIEYTNFCSIYETKRNFEHIQQSKTRILDRSTYFTHPCPCTPSARSEGKRCACARSAARFESGWRRSPAPIDATPPSTYRYSQPAPANNRDSNSIFRPPLPPSIKRCLTNVQPKDVLINEFETIHWCYTTAYFFRWTK